MATKQVNPDTIQAEVKLAKPGDVLQAVPGVYPGISVSSVKGSALAPITLEALEPGTVLFSGAAPGRADCLYFNGSPHWRLRNLRATGGATVLYLGLSSFTEVHDCEIFGGKVQGIRTGGSRSLLIDGCLIHDIAEQHGVYIAGGEDASDCIVRNCQIWRTGRGSVQANAQGKATAIENLLVEDCTFWRAGMTNQAACLNMIGVRNSRFLSIRAYSCLAGGISFSGFAATATKPLITSDGNLVSGCDVMFDPGQGRVCVQSSDPAGTVSHSTNTVVNCNLRVGRANAEAIAGVNGAVWVTDDVRVLPVASTAPAGEPGT